MSTSKHESKATETHQDKCPCCGAPAKFFRGDSNSNWCEYAPEKPSRAESQEQVFAQAQKTLDFVIQWRDRCASQSMAGHNQLRIQMFKELIKYEELLKEKSPLKYSEREYEMLNLLLKIFRHQHGNIYQAGSPWPGYLRTMEPWLDEYTKPPSKRVNDAAKEKSPSKIPTREFNKYDFLEVVRAWKHAWMQIADYSERAFNIDANMLHSLADRVATHLNDNSRLTLTAGDETQEKLK